MKHLKKYNEEHFLENPTNRNLTRCISKIAHLKVMLDDYSSYYKKEWEKFKSEVEYICQELRDDFDKYDFKAEFRDMTPGLGVTQDCGKIEIIGNITNTLTIAHGMMSDIDRENLLKTVISESDKERWVRVVSESDTFKTVCDRMHDLGFTYQGVGYLDQQCLEG